MLSFMNIYKPSEAVSMHRNSSGIWESEEDAQSDDSALQSYIV